MQSQQFTDAEMECARQDPNNTIMTTEYSPTEVKSVKENVHVVQAIAAKCRLLLKELNDEYQHTDEGDEQIRKRLVRESAEAAAFSQRCPHLFGVVSKSSVFTDDTKMSGVVEMIKLREHVDDKRMTKAQADKLVQALAINMAKK